jgi:hypothetical protein
MQIKRRVERVDNVAIKGRSCFVVTGNWSVTRSLIWPATTDPYVHPIDLTATRLRRSDSAPPVSQEQDSATHCHPLTPIRGVPWPLDVTTAVGKPTFILTAFLQRRNLVDEEVDVRERGKENEIGRRRV